MRVVAFNGSPHSEGNIARLIGRVFQALEQQGIACETVQVGGRIIRGCTACGKCAARKDGHCALPGDLLNECIDKMTQADGILLASPTYFADVTSEMKALMDRAGYVLRANGDLLRRKVGAAIVAVRRAGGIHAFDIMKHFFTISQMITVGSSYWNIGIGREQGQVEEDDEGMQTMTTLGENMAWLLQRIHAGTDLR